MEAGSKLWAITGGHIPAESTGSEPQRSSRDMLCLLNTGDRIAHVSLAIYYADKEPVKPYEITVAARRMRNIRFNDLIDPEAILLATDYACLLSSDVPVIAGFTKIDSSNGILLTSHMAAHPLSF
jgi:hypothetical protein